MAGVENSQHGSTPNIVREREKPGNMHAMTPLRFAAALEEYNADLLPGKIDESSLFFVVPLEKTIGLDDF